MVRKNNIKEVVIYTRVSSEEQVSGYSLGEQERKCKEYLESQGHTLYKVYREEGVSGSKRNRPALDQLMKEAKNKSFDVVFVYKLDRFSRNLKNLLDLVSELESYDVGFKSITETFDTTTPMGKYMLQNMGSIAELERSMIRERTQMGKIASMKDGIWNGCPPYGYDIKEKRLAINKDEAKIVKKMYGLLVNHAPDERVTLYKIQQLVNSWNIPTKRGYDKRYKRKNAPTFWKKRTIGRILTNPVYAGETVVRKYTRSSISNSKRELRPKEDHITMKTPVIISKEVFDKAQQELKTNRELSPRNGKNETMINKITYCGKCGAKLQVTRKRKIEVYYYCYNRLKYISSTQCDAPSVKGTRVEEPLWDRVKEILLDPKLAYSQIEKLQAKNDEIPKIQERIEDVNKLLKIISSKKKKLLDLYLDGGVKLKSEYKNRLDKIEQEENDLTREVNTLKQQIDSSSDLKESLYDTSRLFKRLKVNLDDIDYALKCKISKLLFSRIVVNGNSIDATVTLPFQTQSLLVGQKPLFQYQLQLG